MRVVVIKTPPDHASGDKSGPCTCKGKTGTIISSDRKLAIVSFDSKGQAGIPLDCLKAI